MAYKDVIEQAAATTGHAHGFGHGEGKSKKEAEQQAACEALSLMGYET